MRVIQTTMAVVLLLLLQVTAANAVPVIEAIGTPAGNRDNFTGTVGNRFVVGASDLTIDALGYQDPGLGGLVQSHQVGLWRVSDQKLIATATVPSGTAGVVEDQYRYVSLGTNVTLDAGVEYSVGARVTSGSGDGWTDTGFGGAAFSLGAGLTDGSPVNVFTSTNFAFPGSNGGGSDYRWAPANASAVFGPAPLVDAVVISDGSVAGNRSNFTGTVATAFTLNVERVINALGYEDPGGDGLARDHQVGLWRLSDGALLASVVVPSSGDSQFDDAWQYVKLGSDLKLDAGETYIVGAEVFNGIDAWTDTGGGVADFSLDIGILGGPIQNRFVSGAFGPIPLNDGTLTGGRWSPGNAAFITTPAIPEPTTATLGLIGLAGLMVRRRRAA